MKNRIRSTRFPTRPPARWPRRLPTLLLAALLAMLLGAPAATPAATSGAASPPVPIATPSSANTASARPEIATEQFHYRWKLSKFLGWLAGLFLPNSGEGTLTFEPFDEDRIRGELLITSEESDSGEFWSYEALMDRASGRTLEAGSSYFYDGKKKQRHSPVKEDGVFDIASAIYLLRRDPPARPRRVEVWSDGKIYPVVIQPRGVDQRKVAGRKVSTRHYLIEAVPGAEDRWKGKLELWIAEDDSATPVEIVVHRSGAAVRLKLEESEPDDAG